jgi:O-antigen/teichoic acid export membrane protein
MFRADSILSVTDRFIVIVICGFLLMDPVTREVFKIEWLVYAQSAAYLIGAALAFSVVFAKTEPVFFKIDLRYYRTFLKKSLPYALLILLMATYFRIDSVLLGKLLVNGKEQAGIYAQSFRIIEILSNYGYLFTLILLPVFSKMIKQGESVEHLTRLSFMLLMIPAIILTFGCLVYRNEIMEILYQEHVDSSARVLGILIFSFLGICVTYIFGTLLTANGSLMQLNTMALLAVSLNLTLNIILIQRYGVMGAAIANMATQMFTSVYQIILAKRIFRFKTDSVLMLRLGAFIILVAAGGMMISKIPVFWVYSMGMFLLFASALSVVLGLLKIRSVWEIVIYDK